MIPLTELTGRQLDKFSLGLYDAQGDIGFLIAAYLSVFVAALVSFWVQPKYLQASYLVVGWILGWSLFAFGFADSVSVGSALRWLLSLCCLVTSVGVLWFAHPMRRRPAPSRVDLGEQPESAGSLEDMINGEPIDCCGGLLNPMVNRFLALVAFVVLLISSLTVAGVMLNGEDSLGGPQAGSWFASLPAEVSYGLPAVLLTTAFLVFAIALSRPRLAVLGSATYQYVVLFMLILLFLSPHPYLATGWFLNILQAVSIGMSLYGFAWWMFRRKIEAVQPGPKAGRTSNVKAMRIPSADEEPVFPQPARWIGQLELHTLINGLLVTSLAALVMGQVFVWPDQSGGWVNRAGSPLGMISLFLVVGLASVVSRHQVSDKQRDIVSGWLVVWGGLTFFALLAALLDTHTQFPFVGVRTLIVGSLLTSGVLLATGVVGQRRGLASERSWSLAPLVGSTTLVVLFAFRGAEYDPLHASIYLSAIGLAVLLATVSGVWRGRFAMQYVAALYGLAGVVLWVKLGVIDSPLTTINLTLIVWLAIGLVWSAAWVKRAESPQRPSVEFVYINGLVFLSCIWVALMTLWQLGVDLDGQGSD